MYLLDYNADSSASQPLLTIPAIPKDGISSISMMTRSGEGRLHLKDIGLLADADLAADGGDGTARDEGPERQKVIAQWCETVAVVASVVVVNQLLPK
jgi:hypothetical protein